MDERIKILIVGAGKGGVSLIETFSDEPKIDLVGVMDINPEAPGIKNAKDNDIPTYSDLDEGIEKSKPDLIINVTGNETLTRTLMDRLEDDTACIGGSAAKFVWTLVEGKKRGLEDLSKLYQIGVQLSSFTDSDDLFAFFLAKAKELTGTDAASIAIYDEKLNKLDMVAAEGFSDEFMAASLTWYVRVKGLTATILNCKEPVLIENTDSHPSFTNPLLKKEGVKALMAFTIRSENRIIGISYVDSFAQKRFLQREINAFKLLSTQAAVAIEKTRIIEEIHKMAYIDELTGLNNYRYFLNSIKREFERAKRHNHTFTIVLMDIDHFKDYNDNFGHQAGNYILSKLGLLMKRCFRKSDITARYGGEEFVGVLLEVNKENAQIMAERFREYCSEELTPEKDPEVFRRVTISIGIASYQCDSTNLQELIKKADNALYRAKKQGRNRVVSWDEPEK